MAAILTEPTGTIDHIPASRIGAAHTMREIVQKKYGLDGLRSAKIDWPSIPTNEVLMQVGDAGLCSTAKQDSVKSLDADRVPDYTGDEFVYGARTYDLILDIGGSTPIGRLRRALVDSGKPCGASNADISGASSSD